MTADAVGGVWTYALDLARGLAAQGVAVTLAVLGPADAGSISEDGDEDGLRIVPTALPLEWLADDAAQVEEAGRALASLARDEGAHLVHLNSPALAANAPFSVPVVAVAHSCVATWWAAVRSGPLPPDLAWRADLTGRGYRAADVVLAPTRAFADATARAYGLSAAPLVVRNGRDFLAPVERPADAPPVFAFTAGRLWDDGKNLSALDRAASGLEIPVLAAGPVTGPNGAHIALRHVRTLGRLGPQELAGWFAAASVFVSVARYEPFGLAVLEAAGAGLPLVLSDIPTFRELWDGAALFVPADDERAIADAIERVTGDPAERARLSSAARRRAKRYGIEAMTAGVLDAYAGILRGTSRAPRAEAAA
jgi:glycosyltransferase involved in cell wall biosynthesis